MKTPVPLLIGLWVAWVGVCSFLNWKYCCNGGAGSTSLLISDNNAIVAQADEGIKFAVADEAAIVPTTAQTELEKLVRYMEKHPAKVLILTGGFTETEAAETEEQYLGLERAESFREHLVEMGIPARQIAIMEQVAQELPTDEGFVWNALNYAFKNRYLVIQDEESANNWKVNVKDNLVFSFSDFTTKASPNVMEALEKAANYLQNNPERVLQLTGLYSSKEENSSVFNDLGLARANTVKNILLDLDVSPKQLKVFGAESKDLDMFDSAVIGGVDFNFEAMKADEDKTTLMDLEKNLKGQKQRLHFETGKDKIQLTTDLRQYFTDLAYYINLQPDSKIMVVGHTDNQGSSKDNLKLGERRAEFVKDYLAQNGISSKQIEISSKGHRDPIDSNSTPEGRAKNRRVEIMIK